MMRRIGMALVVAAMAAAGTALSPADTMDGTMDRQVSINGRALSHVASTVNATVEVTEYRDGSDPLVVKLLPGAKRYEVCLLSGRPIGILDEELPVGDTPDRFTIGVEDGRSFGGCLLAGLKAGPKMPERAREGRPRRGYEYCLQCETITSPAP